MIFRVAEINRSIPNLSEFIHQDTSHQITYKCMVALVSKARKIEAIYEDIETSFSLTAENSSNPLCIMDYVEFEDGNRVILVPLITFP